MNPKPCPICGAHLLATVGGDGQPVGFSHPNPSKGQPMCKMGGSHIGADIVDEIWNRRAPTLFMAVVENTPVFNDVGEGRAVTVDMINQSIKHYKGSKQ